MAEATRNWIGSDKNLSHRSYKSYALVRTDESELTDEYVETDYVDMSEFDKIVVGFSVVPEGMDSINYKIYGSYDGTTWFLETTEIVASGSITEVPCEYNTPMVSEIEPWHVTIPFQHKFAKVAVKGSGVLDDTSCEIYIGGVY
jgi:hypothetical protein